MDSSEPVDVAVVIVGLNARAYVKACLESLEAADWVDVTHEVIYVDNGSTDGTLDMLVERFIRVTVIANQTNLGYCKAANEGARQADSRYYYFLNDDTIVLDDAIARLVAFMDGMPDAAAVGSRLLYSDGREQWSGRRFPSVSDALFGRRSLLAKLFPHARSVRRYLCKDELAAGWPFDVDWVSVAGAMVRARDFDQVSGFAEDYYYWHEAVFCDRLRALGKRVLLHPASRVIHHEGQGSGNRSYQVQRLHIIDFHRGALRCYCEHYHLGRWHPRRMLALTALTARSMLLLILCWTRSWWPGGFLRAN